MSPLPARDDVWCITVPEAECFSLANGAIVHNCADTFRYLAMAHRELRLEEAPPTRPLFKDLDRLNYIEWERFGKQPGRDERA